MSIIESTGDSRIEIRKLQALVGEREPYLCFSKAICNRTRCGKRGLLEMSNSWQKISGREGRSLECLE